MNWNKAWLNRYRSQVYDFFFFFLKSMTEINGRVLKAVIVCLFVCLWVVFVFPFALFGLKKKINMVNYNNKIRNVFLGSIGVDLKNKQANKQTPIFQVLDLYVHLSLIRWEVNFHVVLEIKVVHFAHCKEHLSEGIKS